MYDDAIQLRHFPSYQIGSYMIQQQQQQLPLVTTTTNYNHFSQYDQSCNDDDMPTISATITKISPIIHNIYSSILVHTLFLHHHQQQQLFYSKRRRYSCRYYTPYQSFLSSSSSSTTTMLFLPDFTEHPKPKKKKPITPSPPEPPIPPPIDDNNSNNNDEQEITFLYDFIAGGVAGSASVIVGHPFDTIKVRLQTAVTTSNNSIIQTIREFGGISSLFRGMTAPLGAAAIINAIVFGSYGFSSRLYDQYSTNNSNNSIDDEPASSSSYITHDPWHKAFICGAFAGFVQSFIICPLEHIKCRLQIQPSKKSKQKKQNTVTTTPTIKRAFSSSVNATTRPLTTASAATTTAIVNTVEYYNGPMDALYKITNRYGIIRLYQGFWATILREVPAFGLYFCTYDYLKDVTNNLLIKYWNDDSTVTIPTTITSHTWIASAIAGGLSGSLTWAIVYPIDLIKSKIQTSALTTPYSQLRIYYIVQNIIQQYGYQYLFRGLNITLIRALPVNGTIFPVYEFTLKQISILGY
jgi:solute carrier family 25 (mitochondrial carnitine/acylcarnitine transporter), member 20/29